MPGIALLLAGLALTGQLVAQSGETRGPAGRFAATITPVATFLTAVREERLLTLRALARPAENRAALTEQRTRLDLAFRELPADTLAEDPATATRTAVGKLRVLLDQLPAQRQAIDTAQQSAAQAYAFYNQIADTALTAQRGEPPDARFALSQSAALGIFFGAEHFARADALAAAAVGRGSLGGEDFRMFAGETGAYHAILDRGGLLVGDDGRRVVAVENALTSAGPGVTPKLPVPETEWREAAAGLLDRLTGKYLQQGGMAASSALDRGGNTLTGGLLGGAALVVFGLAVCLAGNRLANRLAARLSGLRDETLQVADRQLPELLGRVRTGEELDSGAEVYFADHGEDEIGQVADGFSEAQQSVIAAAVQEAKIRKGATAVFLSLAHRSQLLVHRQLKVLDQAERNQQDPGQLELLFQLDHLTTRSRRNAENLMVLGGSRPARQWRNPVRLDDAVRSAIAETEDYAKVGLTAVPDVYLDGSVVADLVHLLAELIDNASSFSEAGVEVRGNPVGRGLVLEIEDQGCGLDDDRRAELNALLHSPPDFSRMALSGEPRLGLFVVGTLAARHRIGVTLQESGYGGVRAIVLIRSELLSAEPVPDQADGDVPSPRPRRVATTLHMPPPKRVTPVREEGGWPAKAPYSL
ncbi:nitrate- and nitrite sensing domain-containing protein [Amycolatopsis nigrescens]|uniref:nitrate- and nitrite sensing domain-containing protein n=1 Tax=Amycolatopsis nigrescens TaxID=381445 RepID=UPI0003A48453|nr:nitrate- and nitrite sensing domain-containing protein [Amycolatopsis nigrescens]